MNATVIPIRPFQSIRKETSRVGCPAFHKQQVRRALAEFHAGRNPSAIAGELAVARLMHQMPERRA